MKRENIESCGMLVVEKACLCVLILHYIKMFVFQFSKSHGFKGSKILLVRIFFFLWQRR